MKKKGLFLVCLTGLCLCSGCKCGWPAIPLQSQTDGFVAAIRTDAQGQESSRLERRYKYRTWQFLISTDGPVQDDCEIWDRLYEVTGKHRVRIPFQSTRGESYDDESRYLIYTHFFPVGQERWLGMKYSGGDGGWDAVYDLSIMVFTSREIVAKFLIPAVAAAKKTGNYDFVDPWHLDEQNKQLLRIDTLTKGTVVFDLQKGEFVVGKELVTELPVGK